MALKSDGTEAGNDASQGHRLLPDRRRRRWHCILEGYDAARLRAVEVGWHPAGTKLLKTSIKCARARTPLSSRVGDTLFFRRRRCPR
jgi:hypothetical protein